MNVLSPLRRSYAKDIDYLIAAAIYLGTHSYYWARTPQNMGRELSLDAVRLAEVFETYPGLFRKSGEPSETGEHFFALQARYAQRKGPGTGDPERVSDIDPLPPQKLDMIVKFISDSAAREMTDRATLRTNFVAVGAAIVAATAAILSALARSG